VAFLIVPLGVQNQTKSRLEEGGFLFGRSLAFSLLLVTAVAVSPGTLFSFQFFVAALAGLMEGEVQLVRIPLFLFRVMARRAFLDRISLLPDVVAIPVAMMAFCASDLVFLRVLFMTKADGPLPMISETLIINLDDARNLCSLKGPYRQKYEACKDNQYSFR
jgi:hypothetical protein